MILEFFLVDYFVFCRSRLPEILKEDMLVTVKMMMDEININRTIKTQSYLVSPSDAQGKCHNSS